MVRATYASALGHRNPAPTMLVNLRHRQRRFESGRQRFRQLRLAHHLWGPPRGGGLATGLWRAMQRSAISSLRKRKVVGRSNTSGVSEGTDGRVVKGPRVPNLFCYCLIVIQVTRNPCAYPNRQQTLTVVCWPPHTSKRRWIHHAITCSAVLPVMLESTHGTDGA